MFSAFPSGLQLFLSERATIVFGGETEKRSTFESVPNYNWLSKYQMDRLRRSLRSSLRRKRPFSAGNLQNGSNICNNNANNSRAATSNNENSSQSSKNGNETKGKPENWQMDESEVRKGTCRFLVKYLGCIEVFESRGMSICEEALRSLRNSREKAIKASFYVSGDGLRLVDEQTKGLIVDQTIEKVSFCAPDRNFEHGFSYICRDGATRRWMCHGFMATGDSGERLSHAVGCAFAICLEKKQMRDKATNEANSANFSRKAFRQASLTERLKDPQKIKPGHDKPLVKVENPWAVERPRASDLMLQRHSSFRGFTQLQASGTSPFKRQLSLRQPQANFNQEKVNKGVSRNDENEVGEDEGLTMRDLNVSASGTSGASASELKLQLTQLYQTPMEQQCNEWPKTDSDDPLIPTNAISDMCNELSQGLSLLSNQGSSGAINHMTAMALSNNAFGQPHESFSLPYINPCQSASQLPVVEESSDETCQDQLNHDELDSKNEEKMKTAVTPNPWDFVPDQPSTVSTSNNLNVFNKAAAGTCNSSSVISRNSVTSGRTNNAFPSGDFNRVCGENGFESDFVSLPNFPNSVTSNSVKMWSNNKWERDKESGILDDPFDANWALLASGDAATSNPFREHMRNANMTTAGNSATFGANNRF